MTKADIWMPLYIGDYLADTTRLTTEQHGAYLLLIMDYWLNGPPPNDDVILRNIARLTPVAWKKNRAAIMGLFNVDDGTLHHKRVEAELAIMRAKRARPHWSETLSPAALKSMKAICRARKHKATPLWLTLEHRAQIALLYRESRSVSESTGIPHEVDHIVPLAGEAVCGLHVPWNLRVITKTKNRLKSNLLIESDL